mmetsp:Transcript_49391/g.152334  ORF Transcript_49391/g.152334 Transcript_49391/m.152334 type:complete len:336 (-) Transcript_49391:30-1037(-)
MDCDGSLLVAVSFATALVAELSGAALGFGPAVLYEISWQLSAVLGISSGALEAAVCNIVVQDAPCGILQLFILRKHFRWRLFALFSTPMLLAVPAGTMLLEHFGSSSWPKRALGVTFLAIAACQLLGNRSKGDGAAPSRNLEERSLRTTTTLVAVSLIAGFLRGFLGVAGPPVMAMLLFFYVERGVWRSVANSARVTMLIVQGSLLTLHQDLHPHCWPMYLALMSGGLIGLGLGNALAPRVDHTTFQSWLLLFLISGAVLMLCSGSRLLSAAAAALVACAGLLLVAAPLLGSALRAARDARQRRLASLGLESLETTEAVRTPMIAQERMLRMNTG